jgi:hypothetical protein
MKNIFILLSFLLFTSSLAQAQYMHSAGVGLHFMVVEDAVTGNSPGASILYGITYEARYNVKEVSDDMSISVSSIPLIGANLNFQSGSGGSGNFILDVPIMAGINFGHLATDNSSAGIGGFINGGYAFAVGGASSSSTFTGDVGGFIHGPVANVGMRFSSKRDLAVGLSYMPSTRKEIDGMAVRLNITYHF